MKQFWQKVRACITSKKFLVPFGIVFGSLAAVSIVIQLLYPTNRTLPFASLSGERYGYKLQGELQQRVEQLLPQSKATLRVNGEERLTLPASELGATYNAAAVAKYAVVYPLWQRLLPFSIVLAHPNLNNMTFEFDEQKLSNKITEQLGILQVSPKDATVTVMGGKATAQEEVAGAKVTDNAARQAILTSQYSLGNTQTVTVPFTAVQADRKKAAVEDIAKQANTVIEHDFTLTYESTSLVVKRETLGAWLRFVDKEDGSLAMSYSTDNIGTYLLTAIGPKVNANPTEITVKMIDGNEISRSTGKSGKAIDTATSAEAIGKALLANSTHTATVTIITVEPKVVYERTYTSGYAALNAYLTDLANTAEITVKVQQIDGSNTSGQVGGATSVVSASTYKLYVAAYLLNQVDGGKVAMTDPINDTTIDVCLEKMIVVSDNNCAEAFLSKFGRTTINTFYYGRGYSTATSMVNLTQPLHTSANDLVKLLIEIQKASIMSTSSRDHLLGLMKRQIYRRGVPAGTSAVVADKVGFLYGYLNDASIVYHPKGTYVIAILTNNQSWDKIAEITRQVEKILYP